MGDLTGSQASEAVSLIYVATSTYLVDSSQIADAVPEHRAWIVDLYDDGVMLASGPQANGSGGVLVFRASDDAAASALVDADPLARRRLADYRLTSFRPTPLPHRSTALEAFLTLTIDRSHSGTSDQHPEGVET